ncbi:unnamed protein product [Brassicogethes aeneus]|uniref:Glycolipid transfer protein domain-containing protein n=1 Tax=Brassicogethes aeneus TaxID=1431903 RepID=A0A9P0B5L3_BRAAE|nr:unnamed protein product [Brassicogethes aeneus]
MSERFDLEIVYKNFESAKHEEDDVNLEHYLLSFEELNKFFTLIGTIFGFVSKDLIEKMEVLRVFLKDEAKSEKFKTVKNMISYESENELLKKKGYTSGCRTLLRLHRGLDFIRLFLKKLSDLNNEDDTCYVCKESYLETLANHHTFLIRNGAKLAIYTLPKRGELLNRVCGSEEEINKTLELLPSTLEATTQIFNRIDKLYTENNLHSLP